MSAALATVSVAILSPVLGWILQHAHSQCVWPMGFLFFLSLKIVKASENVLSQKTVMTCSLMISIFFS